MMWMPRSTALSTIGASDGMPGLFIISSARSTFSSVWRPSSQAMPWLSSICLYLSLMADMSDTKTSKPSFFASTAAPAPLSPAPNITILFILPYRFYEELQE